MTSLKFQLRISLLFFVGLGHNLVSDLSCPCYFEVIYRSCDLEGHLDIWGQWQGQCIFFLHRLIYSFITPPFIYQVISNVWMWLLEKRTSGWKGITSSIHLNKNISVIYCPIAIKLILLRAEWSFLLFRTKHFYVTSGLADMTSLNFQLRISPLFVVRLSCKLIRVIWVVHVTLRLCKISCDLEGHLDI